MRVKYLPVKEGERIGIDKFPNFLLPETSEA